METDRTSPLARIRDRIDSLDADIHRMLIERSSVIDELIRIKGTSAPGAAFRPDREADMMRRIVMRHEGQLPLSSVEHIWREIITVFTAMQAPFSVVAGPADDCAAHRDVIRFYFGFSIEIEQAETAEAALEMIGESTSKIAVLALRGDTPWWQALEPEAGIKIFAKFPFLLADGRVELPTVYVAGPPVRDLAQPDVCLFSLTAEPGGSLEMLAGIDAVTAISCGNDHLLEVAGEITDTELHEVFDGAGIDAGRLSRVGGFARPIELL